MENKDIILDHHSDGGHGWIKVTKDLFNRTNRTMKHISCYSYQDDENYYLEEDCDATSYLNNLKDQDIKCYLTSIDDGDYSFIRNLDSC